MHVHNIKARKRKETLILTCEKQTNKKHVKQELKTTHIYNKGSKTKALYVKQETDSKKLGLRFLGRITRTHGQACVHRQDYAHVESTPETQKIEQGFKMINLTS